MSRKTILANLHRFVRLNDKSDTQVFTFIVPTQLTRGFVNEVYSENFLYRNQIWVVKFDRKERHVGAYLILRSTQNQLSCVIDYAFVVLNRDHFTKNESFSERGCEFSLKKLCRGRPSFIEVSDLENRHFLFDDGKFLMELELRNCASIFEDDLNLARLDATNHTIESNYFTFGGCDWSVVLKLSQGRVGEQVQPPEFSLVRHSHFEHYCKIGYRITVRGQEWPELSASVEQQLDIKGYGSFFKLRSEKPLTQNPRDSIYVSLKLYSMYQLSIIDLLPTNRQRNAARCYDLNQHDWMVQSDILGSVVKLRFFYMQIANVPRYQTQLVCWDTQILPHDPKLDVVKTVSGPYCAYFSQKESDEGTEVATNLIVEQVCDLKSGYVDPETGALTIQVEWLLSHLLTHNYYHIFDNISRIHKSQMSREIKTLQSENYALEKQLYKYQQSLSIKKLSLKDDHGCNGSDTASLGGVSCPDYNMPPSGSNLDYYRDAFSPQNVRTNSSNLQASSARRDSSNPASRSLSPNANPPYRSSQVSHRTRESERVQMNMISPPPSQPSNNIYVNTHDLEPVYDGSGITKRQLPRNPAETGDPRMTRQRDVQDQRQNASVRQTIRSPESDRYYRQQQQQQQPQTQAQMAGGEYADAARSSRQPVRGNKYPPQQVVDDEYDSLAMRYENRINTQKKW